MVKKRIAIDARMAGLEQRGIGRLVLGFLQTVEKILQLNNFQLYQKTESLREQTDIQIDVLLRKDNFDCVEFRDPRIRKVVADYPWYGWKEQIHYLFFLLKKNYDLVFFTHFNMPLFYFRPYVVFIHDLQMIQWKDERQSTHPKQVYRIKNYVARVLVGKAVRCAKKIIVPSETVKRDLEQFYPFLSVSPNCSDRNEMGIPKDHRDYQSVTVIYEGIDWEEPDYDDSVLTTYSLLATRYVLYVGAFYLHKNVRTLVEAFHLVSKTLRHAQGDKGDVKLVLVGKLDYFGQKLKQYVEQSGIENIIFTGFLPDAQLNSLYHNCALYVHPSLSEWFNLSPLEAIRAGAQKILLSDIPVNREVYGDHMEYAECASAEALADRIIDMLQSNVILPFDLNYFKVRYSFERMTKNILELLNTCIY